MRQINAGLNTREIILEMIDEADEPPFAEQRTWHRRRITFLCDCISVAVDYGFFCSVSQQSIMNITRMAEDVWITESKTTQLIDIWQQLKQLYPPEIIPYTQQLPAKELLELLLSSPDDLRIIEIPDVIGDFFDDQTWIRLFKKHFADVI
ncbi:hypothetical protein ACRRCN_000159 [Escherichia coli]|uniref:hypothetical protein n=1 Tax=Escherichia coli TaxID=562 RepID=UPI0005A654E0|nr:hypothetical protein [Escherichia coli]EIH0338841.1 hypothetical protein [Escherichia coli O22]AXO82004.1 hypothetical protein AXA56_00570 [Escherichia coli]EEU9146089.1 hypothetical protein [Escherichia coli]EEU9480368.1 hypothetical protein [Escherichia coli]EEU9514468.1 hypothetical protein [Escherichia coli]